MALVLYLLFEAPFVHLEKELFNKKKNDGLEVLAKNAHKWKSVSENRFNNNLNDNPIYSTNVSHVMHITKM